MDTTMSHPHKIDTLRYRVTGQATLPQETVRISVTISALVASSDADQAGLLARIRRALGAFIAAEWHIGQVARSPDASGFERVTVFAHTRVTHTENHNLAERARLASREGLALSPPDVDYAVPAAAVTSAVQALRESILAQVAEHIVGYERVTGRAWRLGDVEFGVEMALDSDRLRTRKGAYRGPSDGESDFEGLTGAERLTLTAEVVLKALPPGP